MRTEIIERSYRAEGQKKNEGCNNQDCVDGEEKTGITEHNR